jgi:hypothetical protein
MNDKPRHRSGYTSEETQLVRSACLTVAVTLGAYLDDVVIVGGLVPSLLIDTQRAEPNEADVDHPGTNDLDLGLSLAVLDDERYTEISPRLRAEGFEPDENAAGNPTVQRARLTLWGSHCGPCAVDQPIDLDVRPVAPVDLGEDR